MSRPDAGAAGTSRPSVRSSIASILRLAFSDPGEQCALVLVTDVTSRAWQFVAGTRAVPSGDLDVLLVELAAATLDAAGVTLCGGTVLAQPLHGSRRLLGALVLVSDTAAIVPGPRLEDVRRCLIATLDAADAHLEAAFAEQSARAVRRLFVEGANAQDAREAGTVLARVAADAFQTERAGMYVVADDGMIGFAVGVGVSDELSDALSASLVGKVAALSPVWQKLVQLGGPHLVDDASLEQRRPGGFVQTMSFVSYVAIPLMSTDGALGMVICGDATRTREWTPREHELATQFSLEAAVIIDAARLRAAQREQLARLSHHAHHDGLTGLANRRLLMTRMDESLRAARRNRSTIATLLLDLNDFKRVNDTLGHRYGDELLCEVAERLGQAVRGADTLARLGGDEFAIMLAGRAVGRREALATARRIDAALAEPVVLGGIAVNAVASIGIALFPDHADTAADLLQRADLAMYSAKRSRNGAVVYDASMNDATVDQLTLYTELRRAIANGELRLLHQPKLDLRRNVISGVESLVRWQHPRRGLLGPDEFLPLAESSELIHPLTAWVVEHALRQQRAWADEGLDLDLAVNISARNLLDDALLDQIEGMLIAHGRPERFVVEITETAVMTNTEQSIRALNAVRELGVRVSMDDFGAGHSSLALLSQLPVDQLKIDRQLVQALGGPAQHRALVDMIIHLGHRLELSVVAEGIETADTLASVRAMGCDLGQGYLISRPVGPAEIAELVTVRRLAPERPWTQQPRTQEQLTAPT